MTDNAGATNIQLSFDLGDLDPLLERLAKGESLLRVCRHLRMNFNGLLQLADDDPAFAIRLAHARELGMAMLRERREQVGEDVFGALGWIVRRRLGMPAN